MSSAPWAAAGPGTCLTPPARTLERRAFLTGPGPRPTPGPHRRGCFSPAASFPAPTASLLTLTGSCRLTATSRKAAGRRQEPRHPSTALSSGTCGGEGRPGPAATSVADSAGCGDPASADSARCLVTVDSCLLPTLLTDTCTHLKAPIVPQSRGPSSAPCPDSPASRFRDTRVTPGTPLDRGGTRTSQNLKPGQADGEPAIKARRQGNGWQYSC